MKRSPGQFAYPPPQFRGHEGSIAAGRGFTLVELLVAMTIFVILATLTIGAFRNATGNDGIGAAASTFRNALEGARSRAIRSGQVRGLRLVPDPADPRIVTSLVYVGAPGYDEGTGQLFVAGNVWFFANSDTTTWEVLNAQGLLKTPCRIEIPANSGHWYSLLNYAEDSLPGDIDVVRLAGAYQPSRWNGTTFEPVPPPPATVTYRLELTPTVLEGAEPILLPAQTCIDLDGSVIPGWRNPATGDLDLQPFLEIHFSPRGTVVGGGLESAGVAHFRIATPSDLILARGNLGPGNDVLTNTGAPLVVADPENGHKAVSLFTTTGSILISDLNTPGDTDNTLNNEQAVGNPYSFALRGREGK